MINLYPRIEMQCFYCERSELAIGLDPRVNYLCNDCWHKVARERDGHLVSQIAEEVGRRIMEIDWACTDATLEQLEALYGMIEHYGSKQARLAADPTDEDDFSW